MKKNIARKLTEIAALSSLTLCAALTSARADSASWLLNPASGDWNTPANWSPTSVPNSTTDVATFGISNQTDVALSSSVTVATLSFLRGGSSYNITVAPTLSFKLVGKGLSNQAGVNQTITIQPATGPAGNASGSLSFSAKASATFHSSLAPVTLVNNGGAVPDAAGGQTVFSDNAKAGGAMLIANGGTNGGDGGLISFEDRSDGASARVQVYGNGKLDVEGTSIGSIAGDGMIELAGTMTLRGLTDVTTFSGLLFGPGGLVKNGGQASLTLSGANTYTGGTQINAGYLIVTNTTGSATGTGNVLDQGGYLSGTGSFFGNVKLTGNGGAHLDPGLDGVGTLTVGKNLIFDQTSYYNCDLDGATGTSDQVVVKKAVTTNRSAVIQLSNIDTAPVGTVYTLIRTVSANPIFGTFGNLPDGDIVTVGGNTFQVSYEGGDGNDLTLTVLQ